MFSLFCPCFADAVKRTGDETDVEDENGAKDKDDPNADVLDTGQGQEASDHRDEDDEDTDVGSPHMSAVAQFSALMEVTEESADSSKQGSAETRPKRTGKKGIYVCVSVRCDRT